MTITNRNSGAIFALASAALFGISPALAKVAIGEMSPLMLAGLLYLGSGVGLRLILLLKRQTVFSAVTTLKSPQVYRLIGTIVFGGILAPLAFAYGIKSGLAFEVSLLLNLETVTTTVFAWFIFQEHVSKRVWLSKILILAGAIALTLKPSNGFAISPASLWILAACIFWGIDNNLTRDLEELSPTVLASIKGLAAGLFNTVLAFILGQYAAEPLQVVSTLGIGALSYGISLILFINALRLIGSARTTTYFAAGPFFGMLFAMVVLAEFPNPYQWGACFVMLVGVWALSREQHTHLHTHEPVRHKHRHVHDEHHQHAHDGTEGTEPHDHFHSHTPITHAHVHWPDIHHRHNH